MQIQHGKPKREHGQALILVALMALALVAFVGLALDGAHAYEQRRQMQHAADAGAYVGARELYAYAQGQGSPTLIASRMNSYTVGNNGIGNLASSYVVTYGTSVSSIDHSTPTTADKCALVRTVVTYSTYFIGLIGFDSLDAAAQATACSGPLDAGGGLIWPMLIHSPTVPITYGQPVTLVNDAGTTFTSGTFGWACFQQGSCNEGGIAGWLSTAFAGPFYVPDFYNSQSQTCTIANPSPSTVPVVAIGDCLNPTPGKKDSQPIDNAIQSKVGISVTVLMYDTAAGTGANALYHIVGFGRFQLTLNCWKKNDPGCPSGIDQTVVGKFLQYVAPGDICTQNCSGNFGVTGYTLSN